MLKRADVAVYDLIKGEAEGNKIKPGAVAFGVKAGGVELKICDEVKDKVPAEIVAKLEELRQGVADGSVAVKLNQ
ncbi:hypothetical protein [Sinorhizobium medicae]|nr:hypothetical protein [Sinorhizobium medicae]